MENRSVSIGFLSCIIKNQEIDSEWFPRLSNIDDLEQIGLLSGSKNIDFLKKLVMENGPLGRVKK